MLINSKSPSAYMTFIVHKVSCELWKKNFHTTEKYLSWEDNMDN